MKRTIRQRPVLIVLLLCCSTMILAPGKQQEKPRKESERSPSVWDKDIKQYVDWDRRNSWPEKAVLFAGSSSIRLWPTRESYPNLPVINRGFGGCFTSEVTHFADKTVLPYQARVIVFYAGDNDIASGKTPERVARDFKEFVSIVHKAKPDTKIVYLPIKPSVSRWNHWPVMKKSNALVETYCKSQPGLEYVDIATPMLDEEGKPRADLLLADGLHCNEKGYAIWTRLVYPHIAPKK